MEGYTGSGLFCAQDCPKDYKNFAYYCMKPDGYWRGTGKPIQFEDSEKFGIMYYPKCKEGYHAWGCCNCKYECPEGMKDLTSMCMKQSYQRGNPRKPTCEDPHEVADPIEQVCYEKCKDDFIGGGPLCWKGCPDGTKPCGGALCLDQKEQCADEMVIKI